MTDAIRAALAQPEPEPVGPTDEGLLEIRDGAYCPGIDEVNDEDDSSWQYTSDYIRWLDENGTPQEQEAYEAKGLRAVFDAGRCWGRHVPVPVPVAERLPGLGDCDGEGYCWRWNTIGGFWSRQSLARSWYEFESHWLPATALPLPQGEVQP